MTVGTTDQKEWYAILKFRHWELFFDKLQWQRVQNMEGIIQLISNTCIII